MVVVVSLQILCLAMSGTLIFGAVITCVYVFHLKLNLKSKTTNKGLLHNQARHKAEQAWFEKVPGRV